MRAHIFKRIRRLRRLESVLAAVGGTLAVLGLLSACCVDSASLIFCVLTVACIGACACVCWAINLVENMINEERVRLIELVNAR